RTVKHFALFLIAIDDKCQDDLTEDEHQRGGPGSCGQWENKLVQSAEYERLHSSV
ncbi:unnamed protein product, partial [Allacma fusca]